MLRRNWLTPSTSLPGQLSPCPAPEFGRTFPKADVSSLTKVLTTPKDRAIVADLAKAAGLRGVHAGPLPIPSPPRPSPPSSSASTATPKPTATASASPAFEATFL